MAYDGRAVANYFLSLAAAEGKLLTHLKLQKLLYYAHGRHLALSGEPLVESGFEAWPYGPVAPDVFSCFRVFGRNPITVPALRPLKPGRGFSLESYPMPTDRRSLALMKDVYSEYKHYTATQLSAATHAPNSPWTSVTNGGRDKGERRPIPDDMIKDYFLAKAAKEPAKAKAKTKA